MVTRRAPLTKYRLLLGLVMPFGLLPISVLANYLSIWLFLLIYPWGFWIVKKAFSIPCPVCGARIGYGDYKKPGAFRMYGQRIHVPSHCTNCGHDLSIGVPEKIENKK